MDEDIQRLTIRTARPGDAVQLLRIYEPYVLNTAITFEYSVPTEEEFSERIEKVLARYPYLVAEAADGHLAGYAYASSFKERAAYDWAVELSIYIDTPYQGRGLGQMLYQALEDCLSRQNITNLNACITYAEHEDELHHNGSIAFHEKLGFSQVAHFHQCGFKFGRWWDMVWLEKIIGAHRPDEPAFIPFSQLHAIE